MGKHDRVENGLNLDEGAPASNSKIPLPLKVFGILCIVSGAALVPVLALLIVGMVMALQQGAIVEELSAAALVIFVSDAVLMTVFVRHVRHPGHPTAARQTASHGPDRRGHDRHPHPRDPLRHDAERPHARSHPLRRGAGRARRAVELRGARRWPKSASCAANCATWKRARQPRKARSAATRPARASSRSTSSTCSGSSSCAACWDS